jgi:hypothetical protein
MAVGLTRRGAWRSRGLPATGLGAVAIVFTMLAAAAPFVVSGA